MNKPPVLSDEKINEIYRSPFVPGRGSQELAREFAQTQRDADWEHEQQTVKRMIGKINKMLEPTKLHLCWIIEDGNPEPLDYGLADEDGDEIDIAVVLDPAKPTKIFKEIEKKGWHGKSEYPCHQYPYFGILEEDWQALKEKYVK